MEKKDTGLVLAIVFASSVVSGSLVFFGLQLGGNSSDLKANVMDDQLDAAIERFVEKKQQEAEDEQAKANEEEEKKAAEMVKKVNPVSDEDRVYGNADAKISLIEYSDFQCPYCKNFHDTVKEVLKNNDGEVNWVYRHYPLSFHEPAASLQAMAGECAADIGGNDKFWEFADKIFESNPKDVDGLTALAGEMGLSESAFEECLTSEKFKDKVESDTDNGSDSGVRGTPGTIVRNNETGDVKLISGAQPASAVQDAIDSLL